MSFKTWDPGDQGEYETLLREVCEGATTTHDRIALMERLIADALQAHRPWAGDVERAARRVGYSTEIKGWLKRHRVVVAVGNRTVRKPRVIGVRRVDADGVMGDQQALFDLMDWDELEAKRRSYLTAIGAYTDNVALMDRLLALREMAPGSKNADEAARALGIDLDGYLGRTA